MAENLNSKSVSALDQFTGKQTAVPGGKTPTKADEDTFPADFAKAKQMVIRPVFAAIGNGLKERGHEFNISEEPGGRISIHIVPAGVNKSIHPYDWFPTLSFFGAPHTKTIGLHGRNMRPNSEGTSGTRGNFTLAQVDQQLVEQEVMRFIGEIANW